MSGKNEKAKRKLAAVPAEPVATHAPTISGIEATESEGPTPATIHDFRRIVREHWPLLAPAESEAQARAMLARHPLIEKAYRAGLRRGRDCRERVQRGLGLWWEELAALEPNERGFVVAKVKDAVMPGASA